MRTCFVIALLLAAAQAAAAPSLYSSPDLDRWMYPFNATPGVRPTGSMFGNLSGPPSFDQRDAQVVLGFQTSVSGTAPIPAGLGAANYQISSARLTVTIAGGSFEYDPTYDDVASYLGNDADPGRPIELFGLGFRNGYSELGFGANDELPPAFEEATAFSPPGPPASEVRSAYALGFDAAGNGFDASNNVADGIDPFVMAIGQMALAPGDVPAVGTTVSFDVDLSAPGVLAYLQQGLDAGQLGFVVSSLAPASFGGPPTYPSIFLRESADGRPTLELDVQIVPEPTSAALVGCGALAALAMAGRRRCGLR